jgi:hypothetical protein
VLNPSQKHFNAKLNKKILVGVECELKAHKVGAWEMVLRGWKMVISGWRIVNA